MDRNRVTIRRHHRRPGQARKSLWIETSFPSNCIIPIQGQARKSLWIETRISSRLFFEELGQARKSLWIETRISSRLFFKELGQARKSLWIETDEYGTGDFPGMVRLVRACGSKRYTVRNDVSLAGVRLVRACGSKLDLTGLDDMTLGSGS